MNNYAYLIKAKAKATEAKAIFAGSLQNPILALNVKSSIFSKTQESTLAAVLTTSCRSALTGLSLMIYQMKAFSMIHGATATNSAARMESPGRK